MDENISLSLILMTRKYKHTRLLSLFDDEEARVYQTTQLKEICKI